MKRSVYLLTILFILIFFCSIANAALLGMKKFEGNLPDIFFDQSGSIEYDASSNLFYSVNMFDRFYKSVDGYQYGLTDTMYWSAAVTGFGLAINVNENGDLTGGVSGHTYSWTEPIENHDTFSYLSDKDMVEVLLEGTLTIGDETFNATDDPVLLLAAEVQAFGWEEPSSSDAQDAANFDFKFGQVEGALVDSGLWPATVPTGSYLETAQWDGDWTKDQTITNPKGDKFPLPEPTTMLLLGMGLIGLVGFGRKMFFKKLLTD